MADFSELSDSSDESAVEELLSQAMDHSVLEQIAAINCSGFTSDSVLPSHLETRFRRLNFPLLNLSIPNSIAQLKANPSYTHCLMKTQMSNKQGLKPKLSSGSGSSVSKSSNSSAGNGNFSTLKESPDGKIGSKPKSRSGSFLFPSDSPIFFDSPSPPKKTGCFWCSPKRVSRKNSKEIGVDVDWGRNSEGFLSDLNIFSAKEQQKILKKAMKEEEKINREAEKIVKWAKQGSARMNISDIEDELSDNENPK
ncbi:hypothetical protein TEA_011403 [Camellia sinensis var. sinensis]|uniref:Uncharacterized protein n=1 Tax=Camellia sinensis var. sinensis TaxID=542762 RepID=A0A4V3WPJ8_CAMSN|nr:hypothetical protein TEA_011403 [Camellia sinensis var. sinensis]